MLKQFFLLLSFTIFYTTASQCLADTSPSKAYLDIHTKELAAKSYEDILPLRSKSSIANDKPMSDEEKKQIFPLFHMTLPEEVTVTKEEIKGDKAILNVKAAPPKDLKPGSTETTTGIVDMVLEDGQWKLDTEKWESHLEVH